MDGIHDLGGKHGFGAIERGAGEEVFHAEWEGRVLGMVQSAFRAGVFANVDHFRHAIERIDPVAYLSHGYYGRWLGGLENVLVETQRVDRTALDAEVERRGGSPEDLVAARPAKNPDTFAADLPRFVQGQTDAAARFAVGDRVRTASHPVAGHTRLPAYARDHIGTVVAAHGGWVYPDANAHGVDAGATHLYTIEFSGSELWGESAEPGTKVCIDLFEPYLNPA